MNISLLSAQFAVRSLSAADISEILRLCEGNPEYYRYCPPPVSAETIRSDLAALPPGKADAEKYDLGFCQNGRLAAVMDLLCRYPDDKTVLIGFFMVDRSLQGAGVGSRVISDCLQYLKSIGFARARLGYMKGNPQPKAFWEKLRFAPTGAEHARGHGTVVVMERAL